jgi:hypothetical protein
MHFPFAMEPGADIGAIFTLAVAATPSPEHPWGQGHFEDDKKKLKDETEKKKEEAKVKADKAKEQGGPKKEQVLQPVQQRASSAKETAGNVQAEFQKRTSASQQSQQARESGAGESRFSGSSGSGDSSFTKAPKKPSGAAAIGGE